MVKFNTAYICNDLRNHLERSVFLFSQMSLIPTKGPRFTCNFDFVCMSPNPEEVMGKMSATFLRSKPTADASVLHIIVN
ncbi:hypothetical protein TELCIR_18713 [Teladorsagia circumcincta]|uniref:Uncharacterized protein n=1 Tax=Teladorsagia circumcincta TaxID=45464 RepID=A0A2G9TPB4_TELCI|nr:hypothetical protein TELCIR_18713 [Teladorsagia circumcincta]